MNHAFAINEKQTLFTPKNLANITSFTVISTFFLIVSQWAIWLYHVVSVQEQTVIMNSFKYLRRREEFATALIPKSSSSHYAFGHDLQSHSLNKSA